MTSKFSTFLGHTNDDQLKRCFLFLSCRPEAWSKIEEAIRVRLDGLIDSMGASELIAYRLTDVASENSRIDRAYQDAIDSLDVSDQEKIVASKASKIMIHRAIDIFINAKSFNAAEHRGIDVLLPHGEYLSDNDMETLFQGVLNNRNWNINQILNAGGIGNVFAQLYSKTKNIGESHPTRWREFWHQLTEEGFEYPGLRELLEHDGVIEKVDEEDIPF